MSDATSEAYNVVASLHSLRRLLRISQRSISGLLSPCRLSLIGFSTRDTLTRARLYKSNSYLNFCKPRFGYELCPKVFSGRLLSIFLGFATNFLPAAFPS